MPQQNYVYPSILKDKMIWVMNLKNLVRKSKGKKLKRKGCSA